MRFSRLVLNVEHYKEYAKYYQSQAAFADSLIYIATTPLLYLFIQKNNINTNTFISIVCFYLIGYLIYQKPKISMK